MVYKAEIAAVGEDRGEQHAHFPGVDPLAWPLEVDAEPEVVLDLDEQVGEPDRATAGVQPAVQFDEAVRLRRVGEPGPATDRYGNLHTSRFVRPLAGCATLISIEEFVLVAQNVRGGGAAASVVGFRRTYSDRPASRPRPCASRRALPATATEPTPTDQRTARPRPSAGMPPAIPARRAAPPSARRPW